MNLTTMLWGGLRPIKFRVVLDVITLACLTFCAWTSAQTKINGILLGATIVFHLVTTNFTDRWPIALPMIPFAVLQLVRRIFVESVVITYLSFSLIIAAAALCVLFPAVELAPIKGKYNVGFVDLFLPVKFTDDHSNGYQNGHSHDDQTQNGKQDYVTARLLYPTLEKTDWIPLIDPSLSKDFLKESIRFGAPPPLRDFGWMMHTWRLTKLPLKRNASPAVNDGPLPMVVFSHGLGGSYSVYSYQTMMLAAASGALVLAIDHSDGSAPVMMKGDGTRVTLDFEIGKLWLDGKKDEYVRARRSRTNDRVKEFLAATEALLKLNEKNLPELESNGVSFVKRLNPRQLHFSGHSFGGATALAAAKRRPDLPCSVLAHDPAIDWIPDDVRHALFEEERLSELKYNGGTGGYEQEQATNGNSSKPSDSSIHNVNMLFLYSEQWYKLGWGESRIVEDMNKRGVLGPKGGTSEVGIIPQAQHNEFSDICMLTPLWLARAVGVTGKRSPLDTAEEIALRTKTFLGSIQ